ncbi:MAG: Trm112 family protein [Candidatus Hydrothermales bacterium]
MAIDKELLDIIACPKCKGDLIYREEENVLLCLNCKLKYKIEDDIPVLIVEEAIPFEE